MFRSYASTSSLVPNEASLLHQFDQLVSEGIMFYDPEPKVFTHQSGGMLASLSDGPCKGRPKQLTLTQFELQITKALRNKPHTTSAIHDAITNLIPGSDINVDGFEIQFVGETHLLAFNMFSAFRPHFLLLTQDGYRRQYEALDCNDFEAAFNVLSSLPGDYFVFYNCGVEAGCSRLHKHLQIIPRTAAFGVWDEAVNGNSESLPYRHFTQDYKSSPPRHEEVFNMYQDLLTQAKAALGSSFNEYQVSPHNVVFTKEAIMVIPRRAAGLSQVATNAAGMLGVIWMADEDKAKQWLELGPAEVIKAAGVLRPIEQGEKGCATH